MRTGNRRGIGRSTGRVYDAGTRSSICERLRAFRRVYESLRKKFLIVSINSWTVDVRVADGVRGAGHECAAEKKAELVSRAIDRGPSIKTYYLIVKCAFTSGTRIFLTCGWRIA